MPAFGGGQTKAGGARNDGRVRHGLRSGSDAATRSWHLSLRHGVVNPSRSAASPPDGHRPTAWEAAAPTASRRFATGQRDQHARIMW